MGRRQMTIPFNGKKLQVANATKALVLSIQLEDILGGQAGSPASCAAARACLRQLHADAARVHMGRTYVLLHKAKKWLRYNTPASVRSEIIAYDRRKSFKPGDYVLHPLPPYHRKHSDRHKVKRNPKSGRKDNPRAKPHFVTGVRVRAFSGH